MVAFLMEHQPNLEPINILLRFSQSANEKSSPFKKKVKKYSDVKKRKTNKPLRNSLSHQRIKE
jgi:hypothetical protein